MILGIGILILCMFLLGITLFGVDLRKNRLVCKWYFSSSYCRDFGGIKLIFKRYENKSLFTVRFYIKESDSTIHRVILFWV